MHSSFYSIKDTIRIKPLSYCALITDITSDNTKPYPVRLAFLLTLLDGERTVDDIAYITSKVFHEDIELSRQFVASNIERYKSFVNKHSSPTPMQLRYCPEMFLYVPKEINPSSRLPSPTRIGFELTNRCNFECTYCYNSSSPTIKDGLTTEQWIEAVRQCANEDVFNITLSGGEPMMHPGFFSIVEKIIEHNIIPHLSTNGSLLTVEAVAKLAALGVRYVQVSLDSPYENVHQQLTKAPGSFRKVIDGIKHLRAANINVHCKSIIIPKTYADIEALFELFEQLEVSAVMLDRYQMNFHGRGDKNMWLSDEQNKQLAESMERIKERFKGKIGSQLSEVKTHARWDSINNYVTCGAFNGGFTIQSDGEITLCQQTMDTAKWRIAYFPQSSISDIYRSSRVEELINPPLLAFDEPCRSCEVIETCRSGCFGRKLFVSDRPYGPDPCCPKYNNKG